MKVKLVLAPLVIITLGLVVAVISGFYEQNLSNLGVSKIGYGFPLCWHGHSWIVYPDMPIVHWFSWESLILDIAFWSLIIASLIAVAMHIFPKQRRLACKRHTID